MDQVGEATHVMCLHETVLIPVTTRVIIVGDVHGCFDELQDLLAVCSFNPKQDKLVFVGDLVSKGPKSIQVLRFAQQTGLLSVRGNHDEAALRAYYEWKESGSLRSQKYRYVKEFTTSDIKWMQDLPFTIMLPNQNVLVVHAGLIPDTPLQEQKPDDLYKMRMVRSDTTGRLLAVEKSAILGAKDPGDCVPWATKWNGPVHVVFGHDAKRGQQNERFATGLDTGCCYGGKLTALILPERKFAAVPARQVYTPATE